MMLWMIYVIVVTLVLSIAALSAERALRLRRAATRWVWVGAILGALVIPTVIASLSFQVPNIRTTNVRPPKVIALRDMTSLPLDAVITPLPALASGEHAGADLDTKLERAWLLASGAIMLLLAASAAQLFWRKRRWIRAKVAGTFVYTAPGVGPAVVGLLRPHIVVPTWVLKASPSGQALVIAHEQAHLTARDPLLLTTAICMVVLMPWNLPLWWALRRLRHAMEIDCDARVLGAGHDAEGYAKTLIDVGERQSSYLGTVAAMSESSSRLEQRLRIMLRKPTGWWRTTAALLGGVSVCLLAVAAQVTPPNPGSPAPVAAATTATASSAGYVGYYRFAEDNSIMAIRLDGKRLMTRMLGQSEIEYIPSGAQDEFFSRPINARITFETDARGKATTLVLHQNGGDYPAPRMDDAAGTQLGETLLKRIREQTPDPASEGMVRRVFAGMQSGKPAYDVMAKGLVQATHQQYDSLLDSAKNFGAIQSMKFRGVGQNGWDVFDVKHEHAPLVVWRIFMLDGKVQGLLFHAGP